MIDDTDDDLGAQTVSRRECIHGRLARKCEICELKAENTNLRAALERIADPMKYMTAKAKAEKTQLNGAFVLSISESHAYLQDIAKEALKKAGRLLR